MSTQPNPTEKRPHYGMGPTDLAIYGGEIRDLEKERHLQQIDELWMQGFGIREIAEKLVLPYREVLQYVKGLRDVFRSWHQDHIAQLSAERVEAFRRIQKRAWLISDLSPRQAPQMLQVIQKCEENIAKIQGVLTDRVHHLGKVEMDIKLYDFTDNLPPALSPGTIDAPSWETSSDLPITKQELWNLLTEESQDEARQVAGDVTPQPVNPNYQLADSLRDLMATIKPLPGTKQPVSNSRP